MSDIVLNKEEEEEVVVIPKATTTAPRDHRRPRPEEDEGEKEEQPPTKERRTDAGEQLDFYNEVICKVIPKEFIDHPSITSSYIHWDSWAKNYNETAAMRKTRGADAACNGDETLVKLVTLLEAVMFNLSTGTYIGTYEVQIVLHLLLLKCVKPSLCRLMPAVVKAVEELEGAMEAAKSAWAFWSDSTSTRYKIIYKEAIHCIKKLRTPVIGTYFIYTSGSNVFGISPPNYDFF